MNGLTTCRFHKIRSTQFPPSLVRPPPPVGYTETLRTIGEFDLVLLGLGEDGHTASLFPNHDWGIAPDAPDVLAVFNAPKPLTERVSLSAARLSRAREVLFLIAGDAKREAVKRWRAGENIPASRDPAARRCRCAAGVEAAFRGRHVNRSAPSIGFPMCRRSET